MNTFFSTFKRIVATQVLPEQSAYFWLFVVLAAIGNSFLSIGSVPLMDVDEGAFTEATREMLSTGDFISTYLNGQPRHDKPILFYWLQALSIAVFGWKEWAMRLPSVLCGIAWSSSVWWFCRKIHCSKQTSLLAALMVLTSLHLTVIIKVATADALLNLWLALSMFNLILFLHHSDQRSLRYAALFAALGFITKGPISVVIPGGMLLLYCASNRNFRPIGSILSDVYSWIIFIAVAMPWYVIVTLKDNGAFLNGFLFNHNLNRFNSVMQGHTGPIYYYLPVMFLALLPYSPLLIELVKNWRSLWDQPTDRMMLLWFGFVFVLFSLSTTKLPHYLIYGYSGLVVLMAKHSDQINYSRGLFITALILNIVFLAFPATINQLAPQIRDAYLRDLVIEGIGFFTFSYYAVVSSVLVVLGYFILGKTNRFQDKLALTGLAVSFLVAAFIMPAVILSYQTPIVNAAQISKNYPNKVIFWRFHMPSFSIYRQQITETGEPLPGVIVLTKAKFAGELPLHQTLYHGQGVILAKIN